MILEHYSKDGLSWPPRDAEQRPLDADSNFKPLGFWVSVKGEDDWLDWCEGNDFRPDFLATVNEVTLADDHNVLIISSEEEMLALNEKYVVPHPRIPELSFGVFDWPRFAAEYDGLIIAPYQWRCRMNMMWYYGWDCASGCIWNAKAIASFGEPVRREVAYEQRNVA